MKTAHIVVPVADIYKDHTFTSEVVTQGLESEEVIILDTYNNWSKVEQWDGYKGWINNFYLGGEIVYDRDRLGIPEFIVEGMSHKTFSDSFELRDGIINDCIKVLGVPYKWGGKSPFGFDCSGLVQTVFKVNGILLPRDSMDQYEIIKKNKIELQINAKPGDLLFFEENKKICHVAIYNNDMKFIHSSGKVKENSLVEEDELFDKKLMDKFIGIFSISEIIQEQLNERK